MTTIITVNFEVIIQPSEHDDQQLRGYFFMGTRVRDGIIDKTSLSFVFVYIMNF